MPALANFEKPIVGDQDTCHGCTSNPMAYLRTPAPAAPEVPTKGRPKPTVDPDGRRHKDYLRLFIYG
jgi:hypothetical protein